MTDAGTGWVTSRVSGAVVCPICGSLVEDYFKYRELHAAQHT